MPNDEIPRGPESIPVWGIIKQHYLMVIVIDIKSNRKIRAEKINYSDREARIWLGKLTFWATTNKYKIETCAEADYVVEE